MWPEASSVSLVNLVKNFLLQFQRYRIIPRGLIFWRALYVPGTAEYIGSVS